MKAICDRAMLNEAFQIAQSAVNSRSPKPALQCVRIEATGKQLRLLSTDLEVGMRVTLTEGMQIEEEGIALLPADKMGSILKELSSETVSLTTSEMNAVIETEDSRFSIMGDDPADFPAVPDFGADGAIEIEGEKLSKMIERTVFATAREAARYALNGVLWEVRGKEIRLVATDGHRLAISKGQCKSEAGSGQISAIVPTKAVNLVDRVIQSAETVSVQLGEKDLLVKADNVVVYSRLVDGHFPQYEDVVPKDSDKKAELVAGDFRAAVRRAALLTNEESRGVKMSFKDGQLVLSSRAPEMGEARVRMAAKFEGATDDEAFEIAFNPAFLTEVLKIIESETVTLQLKSSNKPGLIKEGNHYIHVIMPVNIL